jgi:hypothetical protein
LPLRLSLAALRTRAAITTVTSVTALRHRRGRCRRGKQRQDHQFPHH